MPVCPTCHTEPSYQAVLRDKFVRKNIDCASLYLLGQPSQARRIRDIDGVLQKYIDLGVSLWAYLGLLIRVLMLGLNCTAIFYAFITYQIGHYDEGKFEIPTRIVVWAEFLIICCYLLWMIWRFLLLIYAACKEIYSTGDNMYKHNLEVCLAVRNWYNAGMNLEFNLLLLLRYVSPPAVVAALGKTGRRVYGKYGTRVHREQRCADLCCCCCFYGRLIFCTLLQGSAVLLVAAVALLGVFIKVLQLRFLGTADIRHWSLSELLLFGQFVVNMAYLDTRQKDRREAKLELLYHGSDAEQSEEEQEAVNLVEDLALLVLRYHYSMFTALVIHHSITPEDISYIYIQDNVEAEKPRNRVKHEYFSKTAGISGSGGASPRAPSGRSSDWIRQNAASASYQDRGQARSQVVVEIAARPKHKNSIDTVAAIAASGSGSSSSSNPPEPASSGPPLGPSLPPAAARFPYDFYTYGRAMGTPLRRSMQEPVLKERYEQSLWRAGN
ncbi:hypothetical protein Vafri_15032 [Volvox africanus]|nr:hypothetical protein Vafri_15032 [Volvox africanus]